jgi:hypothetical protein
MIEQVVKRFKKGNDRQDIHSLLLGKGEKWERRCANHLKLTLTWETKKTLFYHIAQN